MNRFGALLLAFALGSLPVAAQPAVSLEEMERESVPAALAWLARHQEADGGWKASGGPGHGFEALYEPDAARRSGVLVTSVALLAFLGDGNSPWAGPYRETVKRGWGWLAARQAETKCGCLVAAAEEADAVSLSGRERAVREGHLARMNHLWGTLALLEVFASASFDDGRVPPPHADVEERRAQALPAAQAAVDFITRDPAVKPLRFDFLNSKTVNMDELVLLAAARHILVKQGLARDAAWFEGVVPAIWQIQVGQPEALVPWRYSEEGEYWFRGSISTPEAMIAFVYMNLKTSASQMNAAAPLLLAHSPAWNSHYEIGRSSPHPGVGPGSADSAPAVALPDGLRAVASLWKDDIANELAWFWQGVAFGSYAPLSPESGLRWRRSIVPLLHDHQRRSGPESGSWDPAGPHARVFGREAGTAWLAISMESKCRLQMAGTSWLDLKEDPRRLSLLINLWKGSATVETCAVCGMKVLSNTMFSKGEGPKKYYFCGEEHLQQFEMDPEKYRVGGESK